MLWYSPSYKWRLAFNTHVEDTCMTSYVYQGGRCKLIKLVLPQPYVTLTDFCYPVSALWVSSFHGLLAFKYFGFERIWCWWRFFQKRAVHTRYEIYVFISPIPLYWNDCIKSGKWLIVYIYVRGIHFTSVYTIFD